MIKEEAGKDNTITLDTSIIGRGTTIKTSDKINESGGIHVIIDGLHETSSRNQEQYKARTARGSNAGSTKKFFSIEDIPEEYRNEFKDRINDNPDTVYSELYERIDARTSSIREYVVKFVEETRVQLKFVDEDMRLSEEQKEEVKALINARTFSIKNRACGVSSKFNDKIEEYSNEIKIYTRMYLNKIKKSNSL